MSALLVRRGELSSCGGAKGYMTGRIGRPRPPGGSGHRAVH
ncbi:hypothetical protein SLNWT_1094 [Streptomyces albus]|uniref:Uncharacterized protein n=1 Tax=Streptomyces albus (strain ATCC 21838 / DSM 41398 / FERM P-419 / JCM 4703 / NBRC 107858) TaxID=1081613 RepID=A0A0B5EQ92_STRA4|nr:hypothetical protein SLNWT_1094 [Streptomyces albus]AOU75785.1 hypothetical protein SLNHY_1094 [Streptomyces albus]AYN31589.1 hypothetical protein DUI70_1086 [Streptomyces albus]